eukprot:ANDGO_06558.mRNA.1 hypothetical protein
MKHLGYTWAHINSFAERKSKGSDYVQDCVNRWVQLYPRLEQNELKLFKDKQGKKCVTLLTFFDESSIHR